MFIDCPISCPLRHRISIGFQLLQLQEPWDHPPIRRRCRCLGWPLAPGFPTCELPWTSHELLVGGLEPWNFMTFIFFRGVGIPPTSILNSDHLPIKNGDVEKLFPLNQQMVDSCPGSSALWSPLMVFPNGFNILAHDFHCLKEFNDPAKVYPPPYVVSGELKHGKPKKWGKFLYG